MKPASSSRSGGREAPASAREVDTRNKQTPNADMQDEDAGTAASGTGGRGNAAQSAMKQEQKTDRERGSQR
ncbi:hypothetical protein [Ramlibacter sp.]|uniref:hypothetical protein n=1 Tax=Ramlibacter sp. TaxID=1917967 RepID=UPI002CF7B391|nr:hypothetical protein [Ramlibacter sp.]HWI81836.1 hypothetical protein [Ramlibacter sp.]